MTRDVPAPHEVRSWMFMPANEERFLVKLPVVHADVVILDLEDGVPPTAKDAARARLRELVAAGLPARPRCFVRTNGLGTGLWEEDVRAAVGADGVVVPKVESAADIARVTAALARAEAEAGTTRPLSIVAAVESAVGLVRAAEIAGADPRVVGLLFGAEDFALDLDLPLTRTGSAGELVQARSSIVVAARSTGRYVIDGVYPVVDDDDSLRRDALQARELGFAGKSLFHPRQADIINEVFSPSAVELDYAQRVVDAFDDAQRRGSGAVAVGGHLVDLPIVERARRALAHAARLAEQTPA